MSEPTEREWLEGIGKRFEREHDGGDGYMLKEVPPELYPGSKWIGEKDNRESLRIFLSRHGIDIANVQDVRFSKRQFRVTEFVRDAGGRIVAKDDGVAKTKTRVHTYIGKAPKIINDADARKRF